MSLQTSSKPNPSASPHLPEEPLFPAFLRLDGRKVLVVGAGPVAASKLGALIDSGAKIEVVSPEVSPEFQRELDRRPEISLHLRNFEPADLDGTWFVVAAALPAVNRQVGEVAEARSLFVNAVDDLESATVYLGGIVRRGKVTVAISTNGVAPALAGLLREALDAVLPQELSEWTRVAKEIRGEWLAAGVPMAKRRPLLLRALNQLYRGREELAGGLESRDHEARDPESWSLESRDLEYRDHEEGDLESRTLESEFDAKTESHSNKTHPSTSSFSLNTKGAIPAEVRR